MEINEVIFPINIILQNTMNKTYILSLLLPNLKEVISHQDP